MVKDKFNSNYYYDGVQELKIVRESFSLKNSKISDSCERMSDFRKFEERFCIEYPVYFGS